MDALYGGLRVASLQAQRAALLLTRLYLYAAEPLLTALCAVSGPVWADPLALAALLPATCLLHVAMVAVALGGVALRGQRRVAGASEDSLAISVTAQWVCFARALAFALHMPGGDPLAPALLRHLPAGAVGLLHCHIASYRKCMSGIAAVPHLLRRELYADGPMVELVSERTLFIDRCVGRTPQLKNLVILGSGLDMRPYRLLSMRDDCVTYEVDTPQMTAFKSGLVRRLQLRTAQHIRPVAVDFASQSFVERLAQSGYTGALRPGQQGAASTADHSHTLFIVEGLINYLSDDKAAELLRVLATSYPGASVAMTSRLAPPGYSAKEQRRRRDVDAQLRSVGEPHQFAMPRDADAFLQRAGFEVVDQVRRPLANLRGEVPAEDDDYAVFLLRVGRA